jgi:1-phosphofructokinase
MIHLLSLTPSIDELLALPELRLGHHHRARLLGRQPAGKAVNVARTLGHLGVPCRLVGLVGAGELAFFGQSFASLPVQCELVAVPEVTRRGVTLLVGAEELHVAYDSFPVDTASFEALSERLLSGLEPGDRLGVSGVLAPGLEPGALGELLTRARQAGARLYLDGSGAPLRALVALGPEGVRINSAELAEWLELSGRDPRVAPASGVRQLLDAGVGSAMVSLGADGALLGSGARLVRGRLSVGGQAHAVGAGDAQLAGWLAVLATGDARLERELGYAMGVAAARLRHELPGVVVAAEAEALAQQVELEG